MGFYIRKSIRFGPIRINLSKSGIGLSAGVTGARIGIDSKGRAYTTLEDGDSTTSNSLVETKKRKSLTNNHLMKKH